MTTSVTSKHDLVLLGAHRWRRTDAFKAALEIGLNPLMLIYDSEEESNFLKENTASFHRIPNRASGAQVYSLIREKLSTQWATVGLHDYVCELAADLSSHSPLQTICPSSAIIALRKHRLRSLWNELCDSESILFPVPFTYYEFSGKGHESYREICHLFKARRVGCFDRRQIAGLHPCHRARAPDPI
jgi:hypothetical protein